MKQNKIKQQISPTNKNEKITRKAAVKKVGKYAAVTAAAMFVVLSPKESQAQSGTPLPGW